MMQRRGFTLIEMVGVIGATGMLLTLSALLLHKAFDAHRATLSHLQQVRSLALFVERWRSDVQAAKQVTPGEELRIEKAENREIVYSIINQSVVRTRRQDGEAIGQDHWQLPSKCTATWKIDDRGRIPLLIGKLEFSGDPVEFDEVTFVARIGLGGNP